MVESCPSFRQSESKSPVAAQVVRLPPQTTRGCQSPAVCQETEHGWATSGEMRATLRWNPDLVERGLLYP